MKSFFQKLILDVARGGSLVERLSDELDWSTGSGTEILELRRLMLPQDPVTKRLETDFFMDETTENIPLVNKVFEPPTFFVHQGKFCRSYLFAASHATGHESHDCLEILVGFPQAFEERFDFCLLSHFESIGVIQRERERLERAPKPRTRPPSRSPFYRIASLDTLREPFLGLKQSPPELFSVNSFGLQVQFQDTLNLTQARQLCLLVVEAGNSIASAKAAGRLARYTT